MSNIATIKNKKSFSSSLVSKSIFFIISTVIITAVVILINFYNGFIDTLEDQYESLTNSVSAEADYLSNYNGFISDYNKRDYENTQIYINVLKRYFYKNGHNEEQMTRANELVGDLGHVYYINSDGNISKGNNCPALTLSDDIMDELLTTGMSFDDLASLYASNVAPNEYIVIYWFENSIEKKLTTLDRFNACRGQAIVLDKDNTIVSVKNGTYDSYDKFDALKEGNKIQNVKKEKLDDFYKLTFSDTAGNKFIGVLSQPDDGGYSFLAFSPISYVLNLTIKDSFYPILIFLVYMIITVIISLYIGKKSTSRKHLIGKFYYTGAIKHISAALLFNMLVFLTVTAILSVLRVYNANNESADINLKYLNDAIIQYDDFSNTLEDFYIQSMKNRAEIVNWMMLSDSKWLEETQPEEIAELLGATSIDIYDANGMAIYTTIGNGGFVLSKDEDNSASEAWGLFDDIEKSMAVQDSSDDNCYIVAVRLRTNNGIILLHIPSEDLIKLKKSFSLDNALINSDFNNAAKVYIDKENPESVKWVIPYNSNVNTYQNTLGEKMMIDGYSGDSYFINANYYFNTMSNDKYILMNAVNKLYLLRRGLGSVGYTLLCYLVMGIMIICSTSIVRADSEKSLGEMEADTEKEILDKCLRNSLRISVLVFIIVFTLLTLYENYCMNNAITKYLFGNEKIHEINIFSLTAMTILILWGMIFVKLQKSFIDFISYSMGPQAITIGHLISSIVKVILWVSIVLFGLYQLGVNTSTLIASAGITSVVIGIGAQSTVGDIIAGLFIVLEGHVRIGDWVRVNDFRGIVTSVGIRTTKITLDGDTISINNSNMKDVINLSKEESVIHIHFLVEYGTDPNLVRDIINNNSERYYRECPTLTVAPVFNYLSDMAASGIEVHIYCKSIEKNKRITNNRVIQTTYNLLQENGIGIPFTTITISNEDLLKK